RLQQRFQQVTAHEAAGAGEQCHLDGSAFGGADTPGTGASPFCTNASAVRIGYCHGRTAPVAGGPGPPRCCFEESLVIMERPAPDLQHRGLRCESGRIAAQNVRFIGLDVHAETIAVAVAEVGGEVRSLGTIPNRPESVRRLIGKLGKASQLRVCYEAGPTGYVLYWQLTELGVACEVVAPTLVPVKAGDRVKTDRRDAEKLARCYRAGDLTGVWVPDAAHEALRDLVRARLAAKRDQ